MGSLKCDRCDINEHQKKGILVRERNKKIIRVTLSSESRHCIAILMHFTIFLMSALLFKCMHSETTAEKKERTSVSYSKSANKKSAGIEIETSCCVRPPLTGKCVLCTLCSLRAYVEQVIWSTIACGRLNDIMYPNDGNLWPVVKALVLCVCLVTTTREKKKF